MHLLNLVWPNIFEISPHVVQAVTGAINGCRLALGPAVILSYLLQGLWHPARSVIHFAEPCQSTLPPADLMRFLWRLQRALMETSSAVLQESSRGVLAAVQRAVCCGELRVCTC